MDDDYECDINDTFEYSENQLDNCSDINTIDDEINYITNELDKIYYCFNEIWENVIEVYLNDSRSQILDKLQGKKDFIEFMMKKNPVYLKMLNYLKFLNDLKEK